MLLNVYMELVCEKHKERMGPAEVECRHPQEYCKFRSACMIHFLAREMRQGGKGRLPAEPKDKAGR